MFANKEELKQDYALWTDISGQVQNKKSPEIGASGNGQLFTAEYYALLDYLNIVEKDDTDRFQRMMDLCEVIPGVYRRNIGDAADQSIDNYVGLVAGSLLADTGHRFIIRDYGRKNRWCFNVTDPTQWNLKNWMGRFIGFPPHCDYACGIDPGFFGRLKWTAAIGLVGITKPKSQDEWFLSWLMVVTYLNGGKRSPLCDWSVQLWWRSFKETWVTLSDLSLKYFNTSDHPHVRWLDLWNP